MQERETKELFTSAADFTLFVAAHRVDHSVVDSEGRPHLHRISSLSQAVKASLSGRGHLLVSDTLSVMDGDVRNLKAYRKNSSDAFEGESNRAVAQCQALRDKFGPLEALGGGRGVVFVDETGDDFMECDGLFKTAAGVLVVNEATTHFTAAAAKALAGSFLGKLQLVLSSTAFTSNPPEVIAHMAGLHTVVLVASSPNFKAADAEECRRLGIYMLQRDGSGFQCTPPGESMGGHSRQSAARVLAGGSGKREGE